MKKLFTLIITALTTLSASALDDGFYRMQCVETGRYVTFRNNYVDTQNAKDTQEVQFNSLRTVSGFENVVSDPGSIIYFKKFDQGWAIRSQGYGTDESNYYIQITDMGDGSYWLWATYSKSGVTVTRYMRDCDSRDGSYSYVTTEEKISKGRNWRLIPVNSEDQKYIGLVPEVKVGELCLLRTPGQAGELRAEVVGFSKNTALLTPLGDLEGISFHTEVIPTGHVLSVPVGPELLGRVINGVGDPADGKGPLNTHHFYPVYADPPAAMTRKLISKPISLGLRVLDAMLTCGEGQRMGIFAAAGGGKSTLLSQIIKGCSAEVCVLALIGERGREVREFIEHDLGPDGLKKTVLVISTSDRSSMERLKAAYTATSVAEYFRDQGKSVLLMMDSVTRFGRAQREIGLAAGEPPTRRGFPPSVFSTLPKLMERAGNSDKGSITALYTVLVEGDDMTEPIADETRSILDGHIIFFANNFCIASDIPIAIANRIPRKCCNFAAKRVRAIDRRRYFLKFKCMGACSSCFTNHGVTCSRIIQEKRNAGSVVNAAVCEVYVTDSSNPILV